MKMASHVPRKRKWDMSLSERLQKCPHVGESETENNDCQEVFCVDSDCQMNDVDCIFVSEEITKKRVQNHACLSPEAMNLQKASRPIQELYGSSCRIERIWSMSSVCYSRTEENLEELIPIEIDCGPEEITIDDDSNDGDGGDVIIVESIQSSQNLPHELNESTSLTKRQTYPGCTNERSIIDQAPEPCTIQADVSYVPTTNHRVFGELRTLVKFSGGNSVSSSMKADVMCGCITDKGNSGVERVPVHAVCTCEMLRDSYTMALGKGSSARKHQTFSYGNVTESAPVQRVPLQQLLQQGLSVLGAPPGTTNMQEEGKDKQQWPSPLLSKEHINQTLQQRFSVVNPVTKTTSAQEKHPYQPSQQQNSDMIENTYDLRLPDTEGNKISDTESMCQSSADSPTSSSTPERNLLCTSVSTMSSMDFDNSVSDHTEGDAEQDVIPVRNVFIEESHLPPLGVINHPPVAVGDSAFIMKDIRHPWVLATVQDIVPQNNQTLYTVEFQNSKNNAKKIKKVSSFQLAYTKVQDFRFSVGHRIISIFRDGISDEEYYPGVIAEPPKSINNYRYLIFFDNGGCQYVKHEDIRLVVESSPSVWEDVHMEIQDFVKNYLEKYPERALLKVQGGQYVSTEWNGSWYNAKVLAVNASLAQMSFPPSGKHVEWIYRGSARFYPLFEAHNRTSKEQFARSKLFTRKRGDPYIQYTLEEEEQLQREIKEHVPAIEKFEPVHHSSARMSTSSQLKAWYPHLPSAVKAPKRIFYPCYSQVTYKMHKCQPTCLAVSTGKDCARFRNLLSHLSEPMLHGWTREKVKHSDYVSVYYRAPCKRRLRNIEELHKYLLKTKSKMTVDQFDFDHWVRCFTEGTNEKYFIKIEDISDGVEAVPVPCINTVDSRKPDKFMYVTKYVATNGTYIETDPEFLTCCDCTDDCLDKEKCTCWQRTMEGAKYSPENMLFSQEGYNYKRLYEPLITGIYECNSRCKCSSTCLNRLVQLPMKCKIQVFMTPNRGWGIRTLHDTPKGGFICLYAGLVLPEKVGDTLAKEAGDEYQADLNYIEDAEEVKENYEENPYESELEEDCGKRKNSKHREQITISRKLTGKRYRIVAPSARVLFGRNGRYILDAKTCGNLGRFINHSCNPNMFTQNVFVDTHDLRLPWVAFFTNSFVPASTELTWNYGYDVDSVPDRKIICKCGEPNCQGRLL
ncbi:histone-lysine N-methyltransferase eggless-like isoform X1 [Schistocerca serialis cubense]|uniref:histone-lysine N-methyltransferase eggless-like isoform X1 n=1 Tax=Schistocerca serialis cubense TaxID=2023355 RepID=UPI00214EB502|nr:histone-lysine N-methyltransferase eggless-like isoform X1 [Schistocerca serialis cubense]